MEFPKFVGEEVEGWLYRSQQFSKFDDTPEEAKVKLASIHLEGKVLQWHQAFMWQVSYLGRTVGWEEYSSAICCHYSSRAYEDPFLELKNLYQTRSLQEYLDQFVILLNKVLHKVEANDEMVLSWFLGGL